MVSKVVPERRPDQEPRLDGISPQRERAPSTVREDEPHFARLVGFVGLLLVAVAIIGFRTGRIGPGVSSLSLVFGLACLLFHAARDRDVQFRRLYGLLGALFVVAGIVLTALPTSLGPAGTLFLPFGFLGLTLGLLFFLPFARNETDPVWHDTTVKGVGAIGLVLALVGFIGSSVAANFLLPYGVLLCALGLAYLWAFLGLTGTDSNLGYRSGLGIGLLGALVFLAALGRSALPALFHSWGWLTTRPEPYLIPTGLLLMGLGLLYVLLAAGICSDNRLVVMTRRELAAFFYSPVAYIVLIGFTTVSWLAYGEFLSRVVEAPILGGGPLVEPVISYYIISWWPVISMIFIVPVLTMRLLSEERRNGTLEVLLTAPVDETSIVLSKFLAALMFFLVVCAPWGLFLAALRIQGGETFDYRPLLSFFITLTVTGAGFVSMGLFFSSLTRNQIASAILTFVGMFVWMQFYFVKLDLPPDNAWRTILSYVSYIDLWIDSVKGTLSPRHLIFHISAVIFWLFLTVKVLDARKWS